jgi:DEAD/DEAH box helicase domain-containing protein
LDLQESTRSLLTQFPKGIYRHQRQALESYLKGRNPCLTTGTASGKSLAFTLTAVETLARHPEARILAIYPLRALSSEQEARWQEALALTPFADRVRRIDGGTPYPKRLSILEEARILIVTPDILHAWMLSHTSHPEVQRFLAALHLLILDEVHIYTGVFGSNAAYLFRRLQHLSKRLGGQPRFMATSATIQNPASHLQSLIGQPFDLIGPELDTSPKERVQVTLLTPPRSKEVFVDTVEFLAFLARETEERFIAFIDNRKQTERLTALLGQELVGDEKEPDWDRLPRVAPYRSGYEERDRNRIQRELTQGQLQGILSTSALEMGIDLPHLTTAVLYGMPRNATSYRQRIGRVGRHRPGQVFIIHNGSLPSKMIFQRPERIDQLPYHESALYLENANIQYIHAQCLARLGGEDDCICPEETQRSPIFAAKADFPDSFLALCQKERQGLIPPRFQSLKETGGEKPQTAFPLRAIEAQYQVIAHLPEGRRKLGSLSQRQLLNEAYPGAIYYYQTKTFRVESVLHRSRTVKVVPSKRYSTRPSLIPSQIRPQATELEGLFATVNYGELRLVECSLEVLQGIRGFQETRGNQQREVEYRSGDFSDFSFSAPQFDRTVKTTGVLLHHPAIIRGLPGNRKLSQILLEAFLLTVAFERQDINAGIGIHAQANLVGERNQAFLALYDDTYGSLHLTERLLDSETLPQVLAQAVLLAQTDEMLPAEAMDCLRALEASLQQPRHVEHYHYDEDADLNHCVEVILPESVGLDTARNAKRFHITSIFTSTRNGLAYYGIHEGEESGPKYVVPASQIKAIEEESRTGYYDLTQQTLLQGPQVISKDSAISVPSPAFSC